MTQLQYLFTPFQLGSVILKNRIAWLPHYTMYGTTDHLPSERLLHYYIERAKGGVSLITTELQMVHPTSNHINNIFAFDERVVPIYRKISLQIHEYGTKIFGQITHIGNQIFSYLASENLLPVWAPSSVPDPACRENPKEMEEEDIKELIEGFVKSARHQKEGGFDGVEVKMAHDGLLRQFLSPYSNRRNDKYGGSLENRLRLIFEVIDAVRGEIGDKLALGIRLCADEFIPGGYTLDGGVEIAKRIAATGKIDYISPSLSTYLNMNLMQAPMDYPPGYALYACTAIKKVVDIPVFAFGRINDPVQAERILAEGKADMIGMARQLICDPEFPNKAREGRFDDIRPCIGCNQACIGKLVKYLPISCVHNPAAGREKELGQDTLKAAVRKKKIMVVGGGPAGLKVAEIAARRGHKVVLYEKEKELGGQVNLASKLPHRDEFKGIVSHLVSQIKQLTVEVHLETEVTSKVVETEKPDAIVVATGSVPYEPPIPGAEQQNVTNVRDIIRGNVKVGENVVVYDTEGYREGTGIAEFLADRGKKVEIVTPLPNVGFDIEVPNQNPLFSRLLEKNVKFTPNASVKEILNDTLVISNVFTDTTWKISAVNTVVLSLGNRPDDGLFKSLKGRVSEIHRIGDCVAPRRVDMAIYEGIRLGRSI